MSETIKEVLIPGESVVAPSFNFWAGFHDGKLEDEMYGIGIINGIHYSDLDEIHDSLKDYLVDMVDDLPLSCSVDFLATNISRNEGQMSFPETGQWDFPPHIEMDIEVINIDDHSKDEAQAKLTA